MQIPVYERKIAPDIGVVPQPKAATPIEAAYGGNVAEAKGGIANVTSQLAGILEKRALQMQQLERDKALFDADSQFRRDANDKLTNQEDESVVINGQKVVRKKGYLNRQRAFAEGSTDDFNQWYQKHGPSYLKNIRNEEDQMKLFHSMDNYYQSLQSDVISHEVKQKQINIDESLESNRVMKISDAYTKQDKKSLNDILDATLLVQQSINLSKGYDPATADLMNRKVTYDTIENSLKGALVSDPSGAKARGLLTEMQKRLTPEDDKKLSDSIDQKVKQNAKDLNDAIGNKYLDGTLTYEDIIAASVPEKEGGIGPQAAGGYMERLKNRNSERLKALSDTDQLANDYLTAVDHILLKEEDNRRAKQLLIDFWSDGKLSDEEKDQIKKLKENMMTGIKNSSANWIETLFGFAEKKKIKNEQLMNATKQLINDLNNGIDPEKATQDIIRDEYNRTDPNNPIGKDENVFQEINLREEKEKTEALSLLKEITSYLNPFSAIEAEAGEQKSQPEGDENKQVSWESTPEEEAATIQEINAIGQEDFFKLTRDRLEHEMMKSFETEKDVNIKRADLLQDAMEIISGGMTIEEAEAHREETLEKTRRIPGNLAALAEDIVNKTVNDLKVAKQYLTDPIGSLKNDLFMTEIINKSSWISNRGAEGAGNILEFMFAPYVKSARFIGGLAFPEKGKFLESTNGKERLKQAFKDVIKDPEMGYIAQRIGDDVFVGAKDDLKRQLGIAGVATAGTALELLTFNPRGIFNYLRGMPVDVQIQTHKLIADQIKEDLPKHREFIRQWIEFRGEKINEAALKNVNVDTIKALAEKDVFYGNYIKAISEKVAPRFGLKTLFSESGELKFVPEPGHFKSNLLSVVNYKIPGMVSAQQAINTLMNSGISKNEIEGSGVIDYLKSKGSEKVSKQEISDFVEQNKPQVEVVVKGQENRELTSEELQRLDYLQKLNKKTPLGAIEDIEPGSWNELLTLENIRDKSTFQSLSQEQKRLENIARRTQKDSDWERANHFTARMEEFDLSEPGKGGLKDTTKFSQYQLPGGKNYREVLVKLKQNINNLPPGWKITKESQGYVLRNPKGDITGFYEDTPEKALSNAQTYVGSFKSPHWEETDVLAHARMNDRVTVDGKKVDFIEEEQSDWANEQRSLGNKGISSHPLLKSWHELILKQALKDAVDSGAEYLSWTTGAEQAERYDLSKVVDSVGWTEWPAAGKDKGILTAYKDGKEVIKETVLPSEIEKYIGKDKAKKLLEQTPEKMTGRKILQGEDLKAGGFWAVNLYDKMNPDFLNRYVRKWGSKVETIDIEGIGEHQAVKITPQMIKEITEIGQPMFGNRVAGIGLEKLSSERGMAGATPELPEFKEEQKPLIFDMLSKVEAQPTGEGKVEGIKIEPIVQEAITNTQGAKVTSEGIELDLSRYQKEEQFGSQAIRTGVFYLPEAKSPYGKYYSTGKQGYGGGKKVTGRTTYRNPIIVKAGTGGNGVEKAYDQVEGKGAYQKMRSDVLESAWTKDFNRRPDENAISALLEKYGGNPDLAYEIIRTSKTGNLLPYAIQEHIAAHALRKAGYDAVISHSISGGKPRLAEVFDLRAEEYPSELSDYKYEEFYPKLSTPTGEGKTTLRNEKGHATILPPTTPPTPSIGGAEYDANRITYGSIKKKGTLGKDVKEFIDKTFVPMSTRLADIDETLRDAIRKHAFNVNIKTKKDMDASVPFMKSMTKMSKEDMLDLDFALKNSDTNIVDQIVAKYNLQQEYQDVRKTLDDIFARAKEAGMDVRYMEDYFPRRISDIDEYLKYLRGTNDWGTISKAIKAEEKVIGRPLMQEEKAQVINSMITGYGKEKIAINRPSNIKERKIVQLTPQMNAYYKDSGVALSEYIRAMNDNIEARMFFGKGVNLDKSVGDYVTNLVDQQIINQADEESLRQLLKSYFEKRGTHGIITGLKNFSYIASMGSPISAVTQIGDLAFSLYKNGYFGTLKAIVQKDKITKHDIGLDLIAEEFTDASKSSKAVSKVFKMIGLDAMDAFGKETMITGAFNRLSKQANENNPELISTLNRVFGNNANQVLADLQAKNPTDDVKYMLFAELANVQPIVLSEMPEYYVKGGNMRVFYMLKSYTIKQLDVYNNEILKEKDPVQKVQKAFRLTLALMLTGLASDEIKNVLLGRKTTLSDMVVDNMLKLVGFSKWQIYKTRMDGLFQTMLQSILPPVPFLDDIYKDAMAYTNKNKKPTVAGWRIWQRIPVVGKFYYWWFGGGSEINKEEKNPTKGKKTVTKKLPRINR